MIYVMLILENCEAYMSLDKYMYSWDVCIMAMLSLELLMAT